MTTQDVGSTDLTVQISGVDVAKGGIVRVGLYRDEADFPVDGKEYKGLVIEIDGSVVSGTFDDLPAGVYAVAIHQDVDQNGKINKSWVGIPKEPYAFSNNARGTFGPPSFAKASVEVTKDMVTRIELK